MNSRKFCAQQMYAARITQCSVSVDGIEATHNHLRGRKGSWRACFQTLKNLKDV
jgi:MoaA/NifB/PqqE/SkfB family radical SAM enzyme